MVRDRHYQENGDTNDAEGQPCCQHCVSNDGEKTVSRNEIQINIMSKYIYFITSSLTVNFTQNDNLF